MHWSGRLPIELSASPLARRLATLGPLVDLTESNPTRVGLAYPSDQILAALAQPEALTYQPHPLGSSRARRAVADYLAASGVGAEPDHVVLTASTSEAYAYLFKLFCSPGDAVAVPAPSYPLFEHLAELEGVRVLRYRLHFDDRWWLDVESLKAALAAGARAVIWVQPNNPTGSCLSAAEAQAMRELCQQHDVPLVSDEVFGPYGADGRRLATLGGSTEGPLTLVLDGLSKAAGLPQLKLGWLTPFGPASGVRELLERLTFVADTYLSVSAPVQVALAELLALAPALQTQIRARVMANRRTLTRALSKVPAASLLPSDGGWSVVLRLPRTKSDDEIVLALAQHAGVLVHPGYFYDFDQEGYLVLGLLLPPEEFSRASERLAATLAQQL